MAQYKSASRNSLLQCLLPHVLFLAMWGTIVLIAAVLPLYYLQFPDALIWHLGNWTEWPAHLLFPNFAIVQTGPQRLVPTPLTDNLALKQDGLLFASFVTTCLGYILALRFLPRTVSLRFVLITAALLGLVFVFFVAVLSSADVLIYIAYARMAILYHLNPLSKAPVAMPPDPLYPFISWPNQPSIYGPTWVVIICAFQWISLHVVPNGFKNIALMVVLLRLWGLLMHLGSTALVWSISGYLQRFDGGFFAENRQRRVLVTLAFAWNPLLLVEACINAHADTTMLFFVLLALWLFVRGRERGSLSAYMLVAAALAVACCIKINVALLLPGLLLFLWGQRPRRIGLMVGVVATFLAVIVLCYVPFWQDGAALNALHDSPAGVRSINSLPDFFATTILDVQRGSLFITKSAHRLPLSGSAHRLPMYDSPLYHAFHAAAMVIFLVLYALHCWRAFRRPATISTSWAMIRWMAVAWMLYCAVGSPWFWSWYTVTFFGLYVLVQSVEPVRQTQPLTAGRWHLYFKQPLAVYLLILSMLALYCLDAYPAFRIAVPGFPGYGLTNLRGLLWLIPLLALRLRPQPVALPVRQNSKQLLLPGEQVEAQPIAPAAGTVKQ